MRLWLVIVIAVFSAVMIFAVIPTVVVFFLIFGRKKAAAYEDMDTGAFKDHYYWKYFNEIKAVRDKLLIRDRCEVSVVSFDGLKFYGDYYDTGADRTAIIFHGIGADIYTSCPSQAEMLCRNGFNVLLVRQRAHNKSEGKWTTIGFKEQYDVLTWIGWVKKNSSSQILLLGVSMGAATLAMASDKIRDTEVKGMVLDSCYYSIYEQMKSEIRKNHIPRILLYLERLMVKAVFHEDIKDSTVQNLENTKIPVMIIHGEDDQTVDCRWSKVIYDACPQPKKYLTVKGANHTLSNIIDPVKVETGVMEFVNDNF